MKECAALAKLLHIHAPVARALELCAAQALLIRDERILRKYCEQLLKNPKNVTDIHKLCIDVARSGMLEDVSFHFN